MGLTEGTTYYVRAYATNDEGTSYSEEQEFRTLLIFYGNVHLSNQADIDEFGLNNYTEILGSLSIGNIFTDGNDMPSDLTPLIALTTVSDNLSIFVTNLITLDGLDNLENIHALYLIANPFLEDISSLSINDNLSYLTLDYNPSLVSLEPLENLIELQLLRLSRMSITSLEVFENLESISSLDIRECENLTNLNGLSNISYISDDYTWYISNNSALTSLEGLSNAIGEGGFSLYLQNNNLCLLYTSPSPRDA